MNRIPHGCLFGVFTAVVLLAPGCGAQELPPPAVPIVEPNPVPRELDEFMARPEPAYKWEKMAPLPETTGSLTGDMMADLMLATLGAEAQVSDLQLTSQEWQGTKWTHRLQVIRPATVTHPDTAVIFVTFGAGSAQEMALAKAAANLTGAPAAVLYDVPNQPLFGLTEDNLIAHTFVKYLETGDANWPLLFPMTKSAVKAMDAVTEFSTKEWKTPVTKFIVTGASKRGWTSWLTAAADKRVIGIIPMVYDNLNLAKQMPHQLKVWGAYSQSISEYTERDLPKALQTPEGMKLAAMVDPWSYRSRFTMPKMIVNAANDNYWPLDALSLYRADLPGRTDVLYVPNARHALGGQEIRVYGSINGWVRRRLEGIGTPGVRLEGKLDPGTGAMRYTLQINGSSVPTGARIWVARSANQDFRKSRWQSVPVTNLQSDGKQTTGSTEVPASAPETPYAAAFAEIDLPVEKALFPLRLSSDVQIWRARPAAEIPLPAENAVAN